MVFVKSSKGALCLNPCCFCASVKSLLKNAKKERRQVDIDDHGYNYDYLLYSFKEKFDFPDLSTGLNSPHHVILD